MKKTKKTVQNKAVKKSSSFKDIILALFVVYAAVTVIQYANMNGIEWGKIFPRILDFFTPVLGENAVVALSLNGMVHLLYKIAVPVGILLSAWGFGRRFIEGNSLFDAASPLANTVLETGIGCVAIIFALFILGVLKLIYPLPVFLLLITGIALIFFKRAPHGVQPVRETGSLPLLYKLCLCMGGVYLSVVLISALVPEIFYDSLVYHIACANWYTVTHGIQPPLSMTVHFFIPGYARLLYAICLLFSDEVSAKVLHYLFATLTALAIYSVSRNMFNRNAGIFSALAFITMPSVGFVGVRSSMEMFLCFFEFLSLALSLKYIDTKERKWLVVSGLFLGVAIGCKYLSLMSWVCITVILAVDSSMLWRPTKQALRDLFLWNAVVLVSAGSWLAFNFYYTGNPIYPALWQVVGHLKSKSFNAISELGRTIDIIEVIKSPWTISMGLKEEAYPGVVFLVFLPLLIFTRWYKTSLKYVVLYAGLYWLMWMNIGPYFYFRYYLPAVPALCLLCGYVISEFDGTVTRLILLLIILMNTAQVSSALKMIYFPIDYVIGSIPKNTYLSSNKMTYPNPSYSAIDWINNNLPMDATILFQGEERTYYVHRKYIPVTISDNNYLVTLFEKAKTPEDAVGLLREKGITHILLNVPEARRLKVYDMSHFEPREYGLFVRFWNRYVREVHRDIADITVLPRGILSMKQQQPAWWRNYAADEGNYVYVYEILSDAEAAKPHAVPRDFWEDPSLFPESRWKKLEPVLAARERSGSPTTAPR